MTIATTTVRTANLAVNGHPTPLSPAWWVDRLYARLILRRPDINLYDDYYRGQFPLPWLAPQAADEFRRILKMSRANYLGLVIDAMCERMAIEGFRLNTDSEMDNASTGSSRVSNNSPGGAVKHTGNTDMASADKDLWRIWQANSLDTYFDQGLLEAAINGSSYLLVAPNPKDPKTPKIWVEHAAQMIVEYVPGTNRTETAAALKVWVDDWTGGLQATLYLPGWIYKFSQKGERPAGTYGPETIGGTATADALSTLPIWINRDVTGESVPAKNPLGVVPVFELPNNPRLLTGGQSELYDLIDPQDRIVKTLADRLMTQDFGAFPQKWISGWPEEDEHGNPTPELEAGRDRVWRTDVQETRFGQFSSADLGGYIDSKREDVKDIASRSRTPAQYLLGEMNNVNGDTLKASESGLVAKVKQRMRGHNDPVESAMRLARRIASGQDGTVEGPEQDTSMEIIWRNPEFRTEGELVDALLKMSDLGVPEEALWERWGATPQEVERWQAMLEDKMQRAAAGDATVVLADRFRQQAAGALGDDSNANGGGGSANGGGTNSRGTQPGQPRGSKPSGGNSSASASKQRPKAKPSSQT